MPTKPAEDSATKKTDMVKYWMGNIDDALKREKNYREGAQKVVDLYEAKKADNTPFAIVYSNTEVLQPALYNARPIPIVTRRFKDADPIGKAAADTSTRLLKFMIDTETESYDSFDDLMQPAVLDGVVTNRGVTRFRYVAQGEDECVYGESIRWDKFFHGYARTWKKVPWIGFEWDMSKDEIKKNFPDVEIDFKGLETSEEDSEDNKAEDRDELVGVKTYKVYEIWDKRSKKVMFFGGCARKEPLRVADDPLNLSGFFPIPRPLNFMRKITTLIPTPLYEQYRQQAQELNDITVRLKAIIRAIKYRGAYNSTIEGIDKMLKAEDNELVPVENIASMPEGMGIDKMLYVVPVQDLAQTAQSLYQQRESVKQVIYEITGISDILRGASVASETATAQQIKNQWGSLRLKKMQKEVQRYCREALSIMLEIAAKKFELATYKAMTGLQFPTAEEKAKLQATIEQIKGQITQQAQRQGQEPQLPPIPPEVEKILASPTWEDVIGLLQNDVTRAYKTDIETNSTIDAEAAQDKQDIAELMNALSQFLNGVAPLVENGTMPFEIIKEMLLIITRRYNFGTSIEEILQSVKQPEKGPDPAEAAKAEATKAEAMLSKAKADQEMQMLQAETQSKMELMKMEADIAQQELQIKRAELALQAQALEMKTEAAREQHRIKMEGLQMKAAADAAKTKEKVDG